MKTLALALVLASCSDRTGERVTLVYYDRASNPPQIYHYIQEVCSPDILVCTGPNQTYSVRAVKRLKANGRAT